MPEIHLRQPGFTYSTWGSFTKNKERIQEIKETRDSRYIYENELERACFHHGMAYRDFKDVPSRTASDKVLRDLAFNIAKNPKYDGYQRGPVSMVYSIFDKKSSATRVNEIAGGAAKNENMWNKKLAEELLKPITRKFEKQKVQASFIDNIRGADLADMQSISKFDTGTRSLLCIIDIYSKYAGIFL